MVKIPTTRQFTDKYLPMYEKRKQKTLQKEVRRALRTIAKRLRQGKLYAHVNIYGNTRKELIEEHLAALGWYCTWSRDGTIYLSTEHISMP